MRSDELSLPIAEGRFRERRVYLSPEASADPGDGDHTPTDVLLFQNSLEMIGERPSVAAMEAMLPAGALFGREPDGVLRALYEELCGSPMAIQDTLAVLHTHDHANFDYGTRAEPAICSPLITDNGDTRLILTACRDMRICA